MEPIIEVLLFEIGQRRYGVRTTSLREVVRAVSLSPLPRSPDELEGLVNLRGRVVPVIDIRRLLGLAASEIRHTDHLLVLDVDSVCLAIRVDHATDLMTLSLDQAAPPPSDRIIELVAKASGGEIVDVINTGCLLSDPQTESFVRSMVTATPAAGSEGE